MCMTASDEVSGQNEHSAFSSARVQCKGLFNAGLADSAWDFKAPGRTISAMPGWGRSGADSAGELLLERTKTLQARSTHTCALMDALPILSSRPRRCLRCAHRSMPGDPSPPAHDGTAAHLQDAKKLQRSGQSLGVGFRSPLRQASEVRGLNRSGLWRGASEASSSQATTELRCYSQQCDPPVAVYGAVLACCTQQPLCSQ